MTLEEYKDYVSEVVKEEEKKAGSMSYLAKIRNVAASTLYKWKDKSMTPYTKTFIKAFPEYVTDDVKRFKNSDKVLNFKGAKGGKHKEENQAAEEVAKPKKEESMSDWTSLCKSCVHREVCMYKKDFRDFELEMFIEYSSKKTGIPAEPKLQCQKYVKDPRTIITREG